MRERPVENNERERMRFLWEVSLYILWYTIVVHTHIW